MELDVMQEQGRVPVTVFQLKGDLNAATFQQFLDRAQETIQGGSRYLLIDLSGVRYISSAGMRALTQVFNWLGADASPEGERALNVGIQAGTFRSHHLKLLNPSPNVLEALKTAGFDMFLEIHKNRKEAVESF